MIKFYADNLNKYSKLLLETTSKGHPIHESLILDFNSKYVYARNQNNKVLRLKFDYEVSDNKIPDTLYVNAEKFLVVCENSPVFDLTVEENNDKENITRSLFINTGKEKIRLSFDYLGSDKDESNDFLNGLDNEIVFPLNENIYSNFRSALSYIDMTNPLSKHLQAVFIKDNYMVASNKNKFFNYFLEDANIQDFTFSVDMIKTLLTYRKEGSFTIKYNENCYLFILDNVVEIKYPKDTQLVFPFNVSSGEYLSKFKYDTYFSINNKELSNCINFLEFFVKDCPSTRLNMVISEGKLKFKIIDGNYIEKEIDIKDSSKELENYSFWFPHNYLKIVTRDIKDENIIFRLEPKEAPDSPVVFIEGTENKNLNLVMCKLRDLNI